jgi:hypothetical protein
MTRPLDLRYGLRVPRVARTLRPLALLVAALATVLASPMPALGRAAMPASGPHQAAATTAPFTLDLSARGDFVAQANFVQCVGASMQMMLNMIQPEDDRTTGTQLELQDLARTLSGQRPDGNQRKGASVRGWTAGLNLLGAGPYRTVGARDIQDTLKLAARAIRETGRPVGLLVWRGRHAWVMAGFTATADPRLTDEFEVTRVIVLDPLYPYGSKVWGASPTPGESLTVAELGRQFVPRGTRALVPGGGTETAPSPGPAAASSTASGWAGGLAGKFVIVMPFTAIEHPRVSPAVR